MVDRDKEKHYIISMDMPKYPLLPVVNRQKQECGLIVAGDNQKLPLKVYLANIWGLQDDSVQSIKDLRAKYTCVEFQTLDEFLDAGWVVD